jgi:transketolase
MCLCINPSTEKKKKKKKKKPSLIEVRSSIAYGNKHKYLDDGLTI